MNTWFWIAAVEYNPEDSDYAEPIIAATAILAKSAKIAEASLVRMIPDKYEESIKKGLVLMTVKPV